MMRTIIGTVLVVTALIGALTILSAAIVGDETFNTFDSEFAEAPSDERHQAAYDLFHGEFADIAEVLYMGQFYFIAYGAVGFLGCCIGVKGNKPRSSTCVIALSAILLTTLAWPWIAYGPSIEAICDIVE